MKSIRPFNLSKQARRDPPIAFDNNNNDPYRKDKGKANSGAGDDLLRPADQGFSNTTPSGGAAGFQNKEWPSDNPSLMNDSDGNPKRDNGTGIVTDNGLSLYDDYEGQNGTGEKSALGISQTTMNNVDGNNRDRKPFNVNNYRGVLQELKPRIKSL